MLSTAVDHSVLPNIATLDTASSAWQALKDLYDHSSSEEKARRVPKEITGDNSSTVTTPSD